MNKINFSILDEIVAVANILEKSGFSEGRLKLAKPHIKKLEKAIPADGKALLYFCAMFRMCMSAKLNYFGTPRQERNLHNLGKFLEVDECYLLRDYDIFDELLKKELLCKNDFHQTDLFSYMNENFFIAEAVCIPIIKNEKIEEHIKTERIIEVTSAEFTDDYEINLTGFGLWCFYGDDACYYVPQKPSSANLILSENINEKELTYDALVKEQIAFFENSMQHEQYYRIATGCRVSKLQVRLRVLQRKTRKQKLHGTTTARERRCKIFLCSKTA